MAGALTQGVVDVRCRGASACYAQVSQSCSSDRQTPNARSALRTPPHGGNEPNNQDQSFPPPARGFSAASLDLPQEPPVPFIPNPPFVSVAVRVRPVQVDEPIAVWSKPVEGSGSEPNRVLCCHKGYVVEEYEFSRVFKPEEDNRQLFHELQGPRLATSVFSGVNETVFAYGQTGSGKTHTIFGAGEETGLLELFVRALFERAAKSPGSTVHACCYEVLGNSLTDLVDAEPFVNHGVLRSEDVVCDELFIKTQKCRYQIVRVVDVGTCLSLLQDARVNRTAGVSSCNSNSSRTHAVVHLFVQNPVANQGVDVQRRPTQGTPRSSTGGLNSTIGALTLVDLAGTEKEHENPSEQGRKSARLLNTSLSSLNRLLRKLQTGILDESERRQSVLNKCLWEYMRPGCGIALIFCVNPLLRHRSITLSTLAMASDSKLINNQRKAQYVQSPGHEDYGTPIALSPRSQGAQHQNRRAIAGPVSQSISSTDDRPPWVNGNGLTPRGRRSSNGCLSTPIGSAQRPRSSPAGGEFCLTPRACWLAPVSQNAEPLSGTCGRTNCGQQDIVDRSATPGLPVPLPYNHDALSRQNLELQNTRLRQKLSRTRARSQERILKAERTSEQLTAENAMLHRECKSLRALFFRQQQEQIAFWTRPIADVFAQKEAATKFEQIQRGNWGKQKEISANVPKPTEGIDSADEGEATQCGSASSGADAAGSAARRECLRALRRERDYWRNMANELKREVHNVSVPARPVPGTIRTVDLAGGDIQGECDDFGTTPTSSQQRVRDLEGLSSEGTAAAASALGCCSSSSSSVSSLPGVSVASTGLASTGAGMWSSPHTPRAANGSSESTVRSHAQISAAATPRSNNGQFPVPPAGPPPPRRTLGTINGKIAPCGRRRQDGLSNAPPRTNVNA